MAGQPDGVGLIGRLPTVVGLAGSAVMERLLVSTSKHRALAGAPGGQDTGINISIEPTTVGEPADPGLLAGNELGTGGVVEETAGGTTPLEEFGAPGAAEASVPSPVCKGGQTGAPDTTGSEGTAGIAPTPEVGGAVEGAAVEPASPGWPTPLTNLVEPSGVLLVTVARPDGPSKISGSTLELPLPESRCVPSSRWAPSLEPAPLVSSPLLPPSWSLLSLSPPLWPWWPVWVGSE